MEISHCKRLGIILLELTVSAPGSGSWIGPRPLVGHLYRENLFKNLSNVDARKCRPLITKYCLFCFSPILFVRAKKSLVFNFKSKDYYVVIRNSVDREKRWSRKI